MKMLWSTLGVAAFWATRPVLGLVLKRTVRTRVLLVCGNEILVVKSWLGDGRWALPGGGIKRGETALQSVIRELREETGITLIPDEVRQLFVADTSRGGLDFRCHCFVASLPQKVVLPVRRSVEIVAVAWLPLHHFNTHNANVDILQAITAWNNRNA